jgi:hypothetical protein
MIACIEALDIIEKILTHLDAKGAEPEVTRWPAWVRASAEKCAGGQQVGRVQGRNCRARFTQVTSQVRSMTNGKPRTAQAGTAIERQGGYLSFTRATPTAANDAEARKSLAEPLILICPPQASDLTVLAQLAEDKKRRTQRAMQVVEGLANPRMKLRSLVHRFHVSTGISR